MKLGKKSLYATALLSVFLLTACTEDLKDGVKDSLAEDKKTEEVSKADKGEKGKAVEKAKDNTPALIIGYKVVGDDLNGYFQVPEDFANFIDVNTQSTGAAAFARGDQSFVINAQTLPDSHTLDTGSKAVSELMGQMSGAEVTQKDVKVNGLKGNVLHTYFSAQDYHLYAYVIEGSKHLKYVSIEYYGTEDDAVRDNVIKTYSEYAYGEDNGAVSRTPDKVSNPEQSTKTEVVTDSSSSSEGSGKGGSGAGVITQTLNDYVIESESQTFSVLRLDESSITVKVYGDYEVDQEYFNTVNSSINSDTYGSTRKKASKDSKGSYVEVTIGVSGEFTKGEDYLFTIMNASSNPTQLFEKHFFKIK